MIEPTSTDQIGDSRSATARAGLQPADPSPIRIRPGRPATITRVMHADLYGRPKSKQFAAELLLGSNRINYCSASMAETLQGVPLAGANFPADHGHPDLLATPDWSTQRTVPWETELTWVLADLKSLDGEGPWALCQRELVRRVTTLVEQAGYAAEVAFEPEFYLMCPGNSAEPQLYSDLQGMVYTSGRRSDPLDMLSALQRGLLGLGVPVTAASREFSPGQFEINMSHSDPLSACDDTFMFKEAVRELAIRSDLRANFMARPFTQHSGSSLHFHISLWVNGENVFDTHPGVLDRFISGLIAHSGAITAFASSTVNSYARLHGGGVVATAAGAGGDDREVWIRVPERHGPGARVELRGGDAAANPYLLAAVALLAGLHGLIDHKVDATPRPLPTSLHAALDALVADRWISQHLGAELVDTFVALKHDEVARFANTVTDWEWDTYHEHA